MRSVKTEAGRALAPYFIRNGYLRWPNPKLKKKRGPDTYKKGVELRLVANSAAELSRIRALLRRAGFVPKRPFQKGNQFRQPLYGKEEVSRFLELIAMIRPAAPKQRGKRTKVGPSRTQRL